MVGVITATVFDTAGAMNVVLMDSGIRTFTFDLFFDRMFTNADIIVPWVAGEPYVIRYGNIGIEVYLDCTSVHIDRRRFVLVLQMCHWNRLLGGKF